ncbi:EsaB/YukD family protein [Dactylosporangium sp. NPDC050688]|uniref:EsaB/YukD family protein n=1 Tax=Dactylosporangium sp. NPDC050688 TaxID=3157217 RepID=UPI0033DE408C
MLDTRSRVTVIGARKSVDVALPSHAPVGEYAAALARMCGQARGGVMPPAWTLAPAGGAPIPVGTSLLDAGVSDGQVLYLHDAARDPGAAPVIEDIGELVADESERNRERGNPRGPMIASLGLLWLVLSAAVAALRHAGGLISPAILLIVAGLVALGAGWALYELRTPVPRALSMAVILTAVLCLMVAGGLLGQAIAGEHFFWFGAVIGANAATVMALAAVPDPVIVALEVLLAVAAGLAAVLRVSGADLSGVSMAAAVAVTALAIIGVAKPLGATIAAWSGRLPRGGPALAQATVGLLARARQAVTVLLAGPAAAIVVTLPILATTHERQPYALALAGTAGLALLLRPRRAALTAEIVLAGVAGGIGVFVVLATLAERYLTAGVAVFALAFAAVVLTGWGLMVTVLRHPRAAGREAEPALGGPAESPDRLKWVEGVVMLCNIASALLAMAVFGVYDELMTMGRGIIG